MFQRKHSLIPFALLLGLAGCSALPLQQCEPAGFDFIHRRTNVATDDPTAPVGKIDGVKGGISCPLTL